VFLINFKVREIVIFCFFRITFFRISSVHTMIKKNAKMSFNTETENLEVFVIVAAIALMTATEDMYKHFVQLIIHEMWTF